MVSLRIELTVDARKKLSVPAERHGSLRVVITALLPAWASVRQRGQLTSLNFSWLNPSLRFGADHYK